MGTGLHDEFAICNTNKIRCTYKLSVVEEPEGSFTFVLVDKVCTAPTRLNSPQCNELDVVLEPGMQIRIGVRFNRYNIDQDIVVGSIRVEIREAEEKQGFCMELVGFQFETALDVVDSRSRMSDKRFCSILIQRVFSVVKRYETIKDLKISKFRKFLNYMILLNIYC
jgi:hypothetical protein